MRDGLWHLLQCTVRALPVRGLQNCCLSSTPPAGVLTEQNDRAASQLAKLFTSTFYGSLEFPGVGCGGGIGLLPLGKAINLVSASEDVSRPRFNQLPLKTFTLAQSITSQAKPTKHRG